MKEINFSRYMASKIVKQYLEEYYYNLVKISVKTKLENNDLSMIVKKKSKINGKKIEEISTLNQGEISTIIEKFLNSKTRNIYSVNTVPYFHNLNVIYDGQEIKIKRKKGLIIKEA